MQTWCWPQYATYFGNSTLQTKLFQGEFKIPTLEKYNGY